MLVRIYVLKNMYLLIRHHALRLYAVGFDPYGIWILRIPRLITSQLDRLKTSSSYPQEFEAFLFWLGHFVVLPLLLLVECKRSQRKQSN